MQSKKVGKPSYNSKFTLLKIANICPKRNFEKKLSSVSEVLRWSIYWNEAFNFSKSQNIRLNIFFLKYIIKSTLINQSQSTSNLPSNNFVDDEGWHSFSLLARLNNLQCGWSMIVAWGSKILFTKSIKNLIYFYVNEFLKAITHPFLRRLFLCNWTSWYGAFSLRWKLSTKNVIPKIVFHFYGVKPRSENSCKNYYLHTTVPPSTLEAPDAVPPESWNSGCMCASCKGER